MPDVMAGRAQRPYGFDDLARDLNVSRETLTGLKRYGSLLEEWQKKFNLVGTKTIPDMWHRHFLDSAQLLDYVPNERPVWLDFGSGAGFPGLVIALLLKERSGGTVHLVESTGKKCNFLRVVANEIVGRSDGVDVIIHQERMENLKTFRADVISARALGSLEKLFGYSYRFQRPGSVFLFPKGQDVDRELTEASKYWNIDLDKYSSCTDPSGVILCIKSLSRKETKSGQSR
jgi:16S rRNA (guanine527-N7)-methyltransferase